MADLRQFDIQGAQDAGYSGAQIQWHLMKELGYSPSGAQRALANVTSPVATPDSMPIYSAPAREKMGPRQAPRTIPMPDDTSVGQAVGNANPMPEWLQKASAEYGQPLINTPTVGSPVGNLADALPSMPQSKEEAALLAAGALIPPGKAVAGAKSAIQAGTRMLEGSAPEVGALSRAIGTTAEEAPAAVKGLTGIFAPAVAPVRGATSQELTAMQEGQLTDEQLQKLRDAGRGNSLVREATPFLHPDEAQRVVATEASTKAFGRLLSVLPSAHNMATMAQVGAPKQGWYRASTQALMDVFGPRDAARFAGLLSAMSPQTSVESNLLNATRTWANWVKAGRPTDPAAIKYILGQSVAGQNAEKSVLDAWLGNAQRALSVDDPKKLVLSGPKVDSFYRNLQDDVYRVTNDAWIANVSGVSQDYFGSAGGALPGMGPGYAATAARIRQGAQMAGMLPAEGQESIWSVGMPLYEAAKKAKMTPRQFLDAGRLTPELIRGTPDFSTLLNEGRAGSDLASAGYEEALSKLKPYDWPALGSGSLTASQQRQMERVADRLTELKYLRDREAAAASKRIIVPVQGGRPNTVTAYLTEEGVTGRGVGHLPGTQTAPVGSKKAYTSKVEAPFKSETDTDVLMQAAGLDPIATRNATGAWRPEGGEDTWIPSQRHPLEINPATAAGARVGLPWSKSADAPDVRAADKDRLNAVAALKTAMKAQLAGAWHATYPDAKGTSWKLVGGKKLKAADRESMGLAAALLDEAQGFGAGPRSARYALADTGGGVSALHMGGTPLSDEEVTGLTELLSAGKKSIQSGSVGNYIDFAKDWMERPGSGKVTTKMLDYIDRLGKGDYDKLDRAVKGPAGDLFDVYETHARTQKQPVRADLMNMLQIMRDQGLTGVKKALASGGFLPAIAAAVLVPSLQQNAKSSQPDQTPAR